KRSYPYDHYLAHILGFTGIDNQGLMGVEQQYDDRLKGESGSLSYFSDAKGQKVEDSSNHYTPPVDGMHLQTTIDLHVQTIIEREIDNAEIKYNPEGALAIAVNTKTADVLEKSESTSVQ